MGTAGTASVAAIVLLMAIVPLGLASPAALDSKLVTIPPSVDATTGQVGTRGGYLNNVLLVDTEGSLTLLNADITAHDVVSEELGPENNPWCSRFVGHHFCPLFASPMAGLGAEVVVEGTDQLEPGTTYEFFCSIHHWMRGTIVAI